MFVCQWRGTGQNPPGATHHDTEAEARKHAARKAKRLGHQPGMPDPVIVYEVPDPEVTR